MMTTPPLFHLIVLILVASLAFSSNNALAAEPPSIEQPIEITQWLLLAKTGRSGRIPFPTNPVTHVLVTGAWQPPKAGDVVPVEGSDPLVWTAAESPDDGPLQHEFLVDGWAHAKVESDIARRAILRAKGHNPVYVNGVPRVTNVYRYGYVMIPVLLRAGDNHFLFRCTRFGTIEATLEPVTHDVMVNTGDATLPDAVRGRSQALHAGIVAVNTTTRWLDVTEVQGDAGRSDGVALPHYRMPPLSIAKLPVTLPARPATGQTITYRIRGESVEPAEIEIPVREADEFRKITFVSGVEGSVQYYALHPRRSPVASGETALALHAHGASCKAASYRKSFHPKNWCSIVSATNRRPYGYDWEDWGRIDAMEALDHAAKLLGADPSRIYLLGHSMGGHGVWQLAGHYPDRFAAIGPSAGWQDFWTYTGACETYDNPTPIQRILDRAANASRTAPLVPNYAQLGVFIIHGDADDCVPIREGYGMRDLLEQSGHRDLTMHVQPGGKHVFDATPELGTSCFDMMELFDLFQRHARPVAPRRIDFTTISPGISDSCHWLRIEQQIKQMQPSHVRLQLDPGRRWLFGTTENVERFTAEPSNLIEPGPLTVQLDEAEQQEIEWDGTPLHFEKRDDGWRLAQSLDPSCKSPRRCGVLKNMFMNRPILVVGTAGNDEENAWALYKARYDNETFWYRGNASFQIMLDTEFDPHAEPDRNVILYGHADTNLAWRKLLGDSPIQVERGQVKVGGKAFSGDGLACMMIRRRDGSDIASVGVVGGTGIVGMRATDAMPYLFAGVHYPDFVVFSADVWQSSDGAVLAAGFFGNDWSLETGDIATRAALGGTSFVGSKVNDHPEVPQ